MTFYSSGLKTHLLDPVHDSSNFRSEWRLPTDTVLLSNFRIANLGSVLGANVNYNVLSGVNSLIKSIHLYDGNQVLDQILEFPMWAGFTAYNSSNQKNTDVSKVLIKNEMGYQYTGADVPNANGAAGANNTALIKHYFVSEKGNTAQNTTAKGWLSLKSILPILDASLYLPTTVFKNLRLVIEYNTNNVQTTFTGTGSNTVEPLLIVDEILNSEKQAQITSQYSGVSFLAIEHDRLMVPAMVAADSVVQSISQNVGGFNNKTVNRILVVNSSTNGGAIAADNTRGLGSCSQLNQKVQVRINGSNVFPRDGITRPNQRLALLNDVWGGCNSFTGSNEIYLSNAVNCVGVLGMIGNLDYFGCHVTSQVNDFQIDYSRENVANMATRYNQQLQLNIFGEVSKSISVQKGVYSIKYV